MNGLTSSRENIPLSDGCGLGGWARDASVCGVRDREGRGEKTGGEEGDERGRQGRARGERWREKHLILPYQRIILYKHLLLFKYIPVCQYILDQHVVLHNICYLPTS